jgi:hypothetical protein
VSGLDEAWAEAEAALPEGWFIERLWLNPRPTWEARSQSTAMRTISHQKDYGWTTTRPNILPISGRGDSPAAALRALAEAHRVPHKVPK